MLIAQNSIKRTLAVFCFLALFNLSTAGKCPFGYTSESTEGHEFAQVGDDVKFLSQILDSDVKKTSVFDDNLYKQIQKKVWEKYNSISAAVSDNNNQRADFTACLIRLAGHDFMDYRIGEEHHGGADGCVNFDDPDNKGLPSCLTKFGVNSILAPFKTKVSLADFVVIAAEAVIIRTSTNYTTADPYKAGTIGARFLQGFRYGRESSDTCDWNIGRMPNPEHGCHGRYDEDGNFLDGLQQIFVDHIFKDAEHPWTFVAAISGAHTVGSAKKENSGYDGFWAGAKD